MCGCKLKSQELHVLNNKFLQIQITDNIDFYLFGCICFSE